MGCWPPIHPGLPGPSKPWADAQDGQSGGLPRAVGAQQPEAFPRFDAKAWQPGRSPGPLNGPGPSDL